MSGAFVRSFVRMVQSETLSTTDCCCCAEDCSPSAELDALTCADALSGYACNSDNCSIRVLTYNFFLRPPLVRTNENDYKDERLEYFLEHVLQNYDIIAFQEVFSFLNGRVRRLIRQAELKGFRYHATSKAFWFGVDGGLALLSRYEIVDSEFIAFTKAAMADRIALKGTLYAKIAIRPSSFIHVFATHLQSSVRTSSSIDDLTVAVRNHQVQELRDFMIAKQLHGCKASGPVVLLGDFNVNARGTTSGTEAQSQHSIEYEYLMSTLRCEDLGLRFQVRDLVFEKLGHHPVTFGDSDEANNPLEIVLTHPEDFGCAACIDYIFWIDGVGDDITVDTDTITVEKFFVNGKPFTQLSGRTFQHQPIVYSD